VPRFVVPPGYADQGGGATDFAAAAGLPLSIVKAIVDEGGSVEEIEERLQRYKIEHLGPSTSQ